MSLARFLATADIDFSAEAIVTDRRAVSLETSDATVALRRYVGDGLPSLQGYVVERTDERQLLERNTLDLECCSFVRSTPS